MNTKSRNLTKIAVTIATLIGCSLYSAPSHAATKTKEKVKQEAGTTESSSPVIDLGVLAGVGLLSNSFGNQIVLGLNGGYRVFSQVRIGGYFTYNSLPNLPGLSGSLYTICPEIDYLFSGVLAGFRAGAKAGLAFSNFSSGTSSGGTSGTTVTVPGSTSGSFVFGPSVAYDYALGSGLSVGGEVNLMIYTSNTGFNSFNLLAALRYWF